MKIKDEEALRYHSMGKPGKIEIHPTKPYSTQKDLSLAYSPGVAVPCLKIQDNQEDVYKYTNKGNLVAVISNGTAVLGLGNIGAMSGKPVMEGKCLLFKIYAGVDAFDIEVNENDPDRFIEAVKAIAPTFGGINLEDIKAPECFEIERRLKEELDIPVMHDDQHGTAIISAAGLLNACEIAGKRLEDIHMVVSGAGAAAIACTRLYVSLGVRKENVLMIDRSGVITSDRENLTPQKLEFATGRKDVHMLEEAIRGADVFVGLSQAGVLTQDMVKSMADNPIIFALANPNPEISYEDATAARPDVIMSTGRSDYPNQINNVIGFPYIFRGALDTAATCINEEMKIAAVKAIAELANAPVPDVVNRIYQVNQFTFGKDYFIPKPVDPRLITWVSIAVAKAAMRSGVARKKIDNWGEYRIRLRELMGQETKFTRSLYDAARRSPKKVVFAEGSHPKMIQAAVLAKEEGICTPILLGSKEFIAQRAKELNINISNISIVNLRDTALASKREEYATFLAKMRQREGITFEMANDMMYDRNYFGMMMVETGDADALITGQYSKNSDTIQAAKSIIGIREPFKHFGAMHIVNSKKGLFFIADTLINRQSSPEAIYDIARLTAQSVKFFNRKPVMALVSYSNFGSDKSGSPSMMHEIVERLQKEYPNMDVDGEMQVNFALNNELRDKKYPFTRLKGKKVNTLIFPNLSSANSCCQILQGMGEHVELIGPIQMGLNKPIHFTDAESTVHEIVDLTAVAVIDAIVQEKIHKH